MTILKFTVKNYQTNKQPQSILERQSYVKPQSRVDKPDENLLVEDRTAGDLTKQEAPVKDELAFMYIMIFHHLLEVRPPFLSPQVPDLCYAFGFPMTSHSNGTWGNQTNVKEFILFGFSDLSFRIQVCLFVLFLFVYLFTLAGNIMIILIVTVDSLLHTPMYFFLKNLSFLELCYISVTVPKMLVNFLAEDKSISFAGCTAQMYCFFTLGVTECFLLAMMAYDRYVAICNPLHYAIIMNKSKCLQLAATSWVGGNLISLGQTASIFSLPYCGPNVIDHFFCDIPPVLKLACTDTTANKISVSVTGFLVLPMPFLLVLYSYARIMSAILKIRSAEGRKKVFSTCASHFVSVTLFFGTGGFTYVRVKTTGSSEDHDMLLSLLYSVVTPLLNPMIYSLRNKEIMKSIKTLHKPFKKGSDVSMVILKS
ncbi:olfactory receptor 10A7-like [Ambystoma mexicanum]|uniref:olfactory receptor 10A7-like n=1 Tax=Ambystoma mexicanum TaxID=8296 RepID=UPI0037E9987A